MNRSKTWDRLCVWTELRCWRDGICLCKVSQERVCMHNYNNHTFFTCVDAKVTVFCCTRVITRMYVFALMLS